VIEGVRVGSRLDHLRELLVKVQQEIKAEERLERARIHARKAREAAARRKPRKPREPGVPNATDLLLTRLGVKSADVRAWALEQDLVTELRRGRIAHALVEQYAAHHTL
jgi:hypothetical protein